MNKRIVTGIDIRCHSILATTLAKKYDNYQLQMVQDIPLNFAIVTENIAKYHQGLVKTLKKIKRNLPGSCPYIALSLTDSSVIVKEISLPDWHASVGTEQVVYQTFAEISPVPVEQLSIDYVIDNGRCFVFAAKQQEVSFYQQLARDSGLKLGLIDTQKQAYLQCLSFISMHYQQEKVMLLDIGNQSVRLVMSEPYTFYREVSIPEECVGQSAALSVWLKRIINQALTRYAFTERLDVMCCVDSDHRLEEPDFASGLAKENHSVSLATFFDVDFDAQVSEPFVALGCALRAIHMMERGKYAA